MAEQTTQRTATNQDRLEERGVEQDEVERAVGRKAEMRRAQESSRADEVFEELAATRVAANLIGRTEVADAMRSDAADAAAQDQPLADEIAQVARPTAAVNTTLEAGEAFLLPRAMPTAPDTATERADAADPRPNLAPFATPEDAAPPSTVGAQAEPRTAEPSSADLTA